MARTTRFSRTFRLLAMLSMKRCKSHMIRHYFQPLKRSFYVSGGTRRKAILNADCLPLLLSKARNRETAGDGPSFLCCFSAERPAERYGERPFSTLYLQIGTCKISPRKGNVASEDCRPFCVRRSEPYSMFQSPVLISGQINSILIKIKHQQWHHDVPPLRTR